MKKQLIVLLVCILALVFTGCSKSQPMPIDNTIVDTVDTDIITVSSSHTNKSSYTKELHTIWIDNEELSKTHYSIWKQSQLNSKKCTFYYNHNSVEINNTLGNTIYSTFESLNKKEYNPYHPNSDGVYVTEYYKYTIKVSYSIYDSDGKYIGDMTDERYKKDGGERYYQVSKEDYLKLVKSFENVTEKVKKTK